MLALLSVASGAAVNEVLKRRRNKSSDDREKQLQDLKDELEVQKAAQQAAMEQLRRLTSSNLELSETLEGLSRERDTASAHVTDLQRKNTFLFEMSKLFSLENFSLKQKQRRCEQELQTCKATVEELNRNVQALQETHRQQQEQQQCAVSKLQSEVAKVMEGLLRHTITEEQALQQLTALGCDVKLGLGKDQNSFKRLEASSSESTWQTQATFILDLPDRLQQVASTASTLAGPSRLPPLQSFNGLKNTSFIEQKLLAAAQQPATTSAASEQSTAAPAVAPVPPSTSCATAAAGILTGDVAAADKAAKKSSQQAKLRWNLATWGVSGDRQKLRYKTIDNAAFEDDVHTTTKAVVRKL